MKKNNDDPIPSVDISSGEITNGPIVVDQTFQWSTNAVAPNCKVAAQAQNWFAPTPCPVNGPGSTTVTAKLASVTGWTFGVTGLDRSNGNPKIPVGSAKP
jgi:hypothetical protein